MGLEYRNIVRYDNMPDDVYFAMKDTYSHSKIKQMKNGFKKEFIVTDKVRLGKLVDQIITQTNEVDFKHPLIIPAKAIAGEIFNKFGDNIKHFTHQVSYTVDVCYEDFVLKSTARLDALLGKIAVIDYKVNNDCKTVADVEKLIEWMGYDNQLFHYGKSANVKHHYLLIFLNKIGKAMLLKRLVKQEDITKAEMWWTEKVFEFGESK